MELTKNFGSLCLKNRFTFQFSIFTVWPPGPVRFWKLCLFLLVLIQKSVAGSSGVGRYGKRDEVGAGKGTGSGSRVGSL